MAPRTHRPAFLTTGTPVVVFVSLLTFLHYAAAQMRGPVVPLYAAAHGATATAVGLIVGAHMAAASLGSVPLGRASDVWGRRALLLGGMAVGVATSLALPLVDGPLGLIAIYGLAGLGAAAFTPSALSMVGDAAPAGRAGHAFAWYSTAHYGAIGVGPFLGGRVSVRMSGEGWPARRTDHVHRRGHEQRCDPETNVDQLRQEHGRIDPQHEAGDMALLAMNRADLAALCHDKQSTPPAARGRADGQSQAETHRGAGWTTGAGCTS